MSYEIQNVHLKWMEKVMAITSFSITLQSKKSEGQMGIGVFWKYTVMLSVN